MSWSRRGFLAMTALAGCGFTPAYAPGGPAAGLQGLIRAADPGDKAAFDLVTRLEERLGPANAPRYSLAYVVGVVGSGVAITTNLSITRYDLAGTVDWTLSPIGGGAPVTSGRAQSFTSFSATGSTLATATAQGDATTRLMRILADRIVTDLLATAGRWKT